MTPFQQEVTPANNTCSSDGYRTFLFNAQYTLGLFNALIIYLLGANVGELHSHR
jgi:hypothetical protein